MNQTALFEDADPGTVGYAAVSSSAPLSLLSVGELERVPGSVSSWQAILDFESETARWASHRKWTAARERFGLSQTRYVAELCRALEHPEAAVYSPALVNRLIRLRDHRRGLRSVGRSA